MFENRQKTTKTYILLYCFTYAMVRKTTSLKIDPELWKEVKIHCINKGVDISDWLEKVIKKDLKKSSGGKNENSSIA